MLSAVTHSGSPHLQSRRTSRSTALDTLLSILRFIRDLPEAFAEAQEMKRQAKQRYPFMSLDF